MHFILLLSGQSPEDSRLRLPDVLDDVRALEHPHHGFEAIAVLEPSRRFWAVDQDSA